MTADMLHVGYAQSVITPSLERVVYLAGFGRNRQARSVHDDLYVRALALACGPTKLVLAAMDLIGLSRYHCLEISHDVNTQVPNTHVLLVSTHTHHGPDTLGLWGRNMIHSGVDQAYIQFLTAEVTRTITAALQHLEPARLASVAIHVPGVAKNARDPEIIDDELTCLHFTHRDTDAPLATVTIFPCHPEVLWDQNTAITADYPGYLRLSLEKHTGAPVLFLPGAIGGMMTPDTAHHTFAEAQRIGNTLAAAALQALRNAAPQEIAHLWYRRTTYQVPLTNPLFKLARTLGVLPRTAVPGRMVTTEASLLALDSTLLITAPGEVLPRLGLRTKAMLQEAGAQVAAVIGLTNDELGYILPAEDFVYPRNPFRPGDHYEETMSLSRHAGPALLRAWQNLLVDYQQIRVDRP